MAKYYLLGLFRRLFHHLQLYFFHLFSFVCIWALAFYILQDLFGPQLVAPAYFWLPFGALGMVFLVRMIQLESQFYRGWPPNESRSVLLKRFDFLFYQIFPSFPFSWKEHFYLNRYFLYFFILWALVVVGLLSSAVAGLDPRFFFAALSGIHAAGALIVVLGGYFLVKRDFELAHFGFFYGHREKDFTRSILKPVILLALGSGFVFCVVSALALGWTGGRGLGGASWLHLFVIDCGVVMMIPALCLQVDPKNIFLQMLVHSLVSFVLVSLSLISSYFLILFPISYIYASKYQEKARYFIDLHRGSFTR